MKEYTVEVYGTVASTYTVKANDEDAAINEACSLFRCDFNDDFHIVEDWEILEESPVEPVGA